MLNLLKLAQSWFGRFERFEWFARFGRYVRFGWFRCGKQKLTEKRKEVEKTVKLGVPMASNKQKVLTM